MHGQHPAAPIGPRIICSNIVIVGLLLGDHVRAGATLLPWPIEMACVIAVGHRDEVTQAFTLEQM